jgi:superfamily II RNA helicase
MAGRAGRRGIDTVGNVIHLNNLFKNVELTPYKIMMQGKPQKLVSKFKISYNLLLNLIDIGDQNFLQFAQRSMIQEDIDAELGEQYYSIAAKDRELDILKSSIQHLRTPKQTVDRYIQCLNERKTAVNKKRKELDREIQRLQDEYRNIDTDMKSMAKYNEKCFEIAEMRKSFNSTEKFLGSNISIILDFLEKDGFVVKEDNYKLSARGFIATHLREIHCLVFAKLLEENRFDQLDARQLIGIFSCFTNVSVADDFKTIVTKYDNQELQTVMTEIVRLYNYYQDFETGKMVNTGVDYAMHYDLVNYVIEWANCESVAECKMVLQKLEAEKGVFLGEFVKAILKINNISSEMEKIAENIGNISLLSKLREIPDLTQKFVATNQSLYV